MKRFDFVNETNDVFGTEYIFASEEEMDAFVSENWADSSPYDGGIYGQVVLTVGESPRSRFVG
jgi:hypothetical protein